MIDLKEFFKNIVVLGGGESGTGAAILAKKQGFNVFLSDQGMIEDQYLDDLLRFGIDFEEEEHTEEKILEADLIIKSPGIPNEAQLLVKASEKAIPVISEIEFAAGFTSAKLIGITGTNGKTSTTGLTHHILSSAGYNVKMAGNVGNSFAREVAFDNDLTEYFVLELSSFQLDNSEKLHLNLSVLLNITPDHLDRYKNIEEYIRAKLKITANQTEEDTFIYNADDENITERLNELPGKPRNKPFSLNRKLNEGAYAESDHFVVSMMGEDEKYYYNDLALKGRHNRYNSMAATIVAKALNVKKEIIRESLANYKNVEHRLEFTARIREVDYINDSKATNVNAAWYALDSMDRPTVWLAGGVDKGNDYSQLYELVHQKVKAIICIGENNQKLKEHFENKVDIMLEAKDMQEAVKLAYNLAQKDDNVLLAPACASFDRYKNYEDRGEQFKTAVKAL